jgi:predicted metalloendopeptidase
MKKVLGLLFLSSSIFSMQVATIKDSCLKVKTIQHKLIKQRTPKSPLSLKDIKQRSPKLTIDVKDCINPSSFSAPKGLGDIKLFHNEKGFHVLQNNNMHLIKSWNTDKLVRKATTLDIKDFQKKGYFYVTQMGDGQFELKVMDRVKGGGVLGACIGAFFGKAAVYVIGHGAIQIAAVASGPLYFPTLWALEGWLAVPIEAASMKAAITCGMLGAVATGPV